jgi:hypothetical protein
LEPREEGPQPLEFDILDITVGTVLVMPFDVGGSGKLS